MLSGRPSVYSLCLLVPHGRSGSEEVVTPLMLDGTYLSRNFATLGPLTTLSLYLLSGGVIFYEAERIPQTRNLQEVMTRGLGTSF